MNWKKILQFLAISFGIAVIVGGFVWLAHVDMNSIGGRLIIGILYMFAPLVAAVIVDRRFQVEFVKVSRKRMDVLRVFGWPIVVFVPAIVILFAATWLLGNVWHVSGVGELATSITQVKQSLIAELHPTAAQIAHMRLPSTPLPLYIVSVIGAITAGLTINGLLAFGEEYGWRGFLWRELKHLGWVRANIVLGIIWGLWHTPLLLQGFNYGVKGWSAVGMMLVFTISMSFLLTALRQRGNVLSSSVFHGMINGVGFSSPFLFYGINTMIGGLVGLLASVIVLVTGLLLWSRLGNTITPSANSAGRDSLTK